MGNEMIRAERSLPVQARVDVVDLADLAVAFVEKGFEIRTQSSLLAHIVMALHISMKNGGMIRVEHKSLEEAYETLSGMGLVGGLTRSRGAKKLMMARGFENLRTDGVEPESYAPMAFNIMHNKHSVKPPSMYRTGIDWDAEIKKIRDKEKAEMIRKGEEARQKWIEESKLVDPEELARKEEWLRKHRLENKKKEEREKLAKQIKEQEERDKLKAEKEKEKIDKKLSSIDEKIEKLKRKKEELDAPRKMSDEELADEGERIKLKDEEYARQLECARPDLEPVEYEDE